MAPRLYCVSMASRGTYDFDSAIAVRALGDGMYDTPIRAGWDIMGNANGGYLLALVAEAMKAESGRRDPITITAHYLSPGLVGDATTRVQVVKQGRRFSTMQAVLRRDGKDVMRVIGAFGDVDVDPLDAQRSIERPEMPDYDACLRRDAGDGAPAIMDKVPVRLHPDDVGFALGKPSGEATMRGWVQFADERPHDTVSLLLASDALPPPIFNIAGETGWVPTVELTVHVLARPSEGPLLCSFVSHFVQSGMLEEDGVMWDTRGVCVATSRQIALQPRV
jgi:acyl-CoA thioesterase